MIRTFFPVFFVYLFFIVSPLASDKVLDLESNCALYRLEKGQWKKTNPSVILDSKITADKILRDEVFTVFLSNGKTYGINQRCLKDPALEKRLETSAPRRSAAPTPVRGDTHSAWSAVFSLGDNLSSTATKTTTYLGTTQTSSLKYKSTLSFTGEANYRFNAAFRLAAELGISQLSVDSGNGNETSFFDFRPEYVFRAGRKFEVYVGPMFGIFFLSQNAEPNTLPTSETIGLKQQTATALLLGVGAGADYPLNEQFDLGLYLRYFKPGDLKISGNETFPTPGNVYDIKLAVSYMTAGLRFVIHF